MFNRSTKRNALILGILLALAGLLIIIKDRITHPSSPSLILITIDTLRADRLGCYGYSRNTSPAIDGLARKSILFRNAITPRAKTTPAIASILTGLYPHTHGLRSNWVPLEEEFITLAEILREKGFRTGAVVGNYMLKRKYSGLDQGFDTFDDRMTTRELHRNLREKTAEEVNQSVFGWLEENRNNQFFLWVHYQDPHGPYTPPAEYRGQFGRDREDPVAAEEIPRYQRLPDIPVSDGKIDANAYRAAYDEDIRYCDDFIGRLVEKLEELELADTLIILTADHGESLGEHGYYFEHGKYVYDQSVRVPFLVYSPGKFDPRIIEEQVNIMNITPTVLEILDCPIPPEIEGRSLLSLIRGETTEGDEYIFIESMNRYKAVRDRQWKYIKNISTGKEELYELEKDPGEEYNRADEYPAVTAALSRKVEAWLNPNDRIPLKELNEMRINKEERKALFSLGYLK
jgi:arylsulfatase A-like enzyme